MSSPSDLLAPIDQFELRHSGRADSGELAEMLATVGYDSLDALSAAAVPADIRLPRELALPEAVGETAALGELRTLAAQNQVFRSFIGAGYYDCATPAVIQRNILENPGWYTAYTPYQSEISQGRLEALLNFQTLVSELTALDIANASMLDEGTAAAEAMMMCHRIKLGGRSDAARFFVSELCHPQTIEVVRTRAEPLGIEVVVGDHRTFEFEAAGDQEDGAAAAEGRSGSVCDRDFTQESQQGEAASATVVGVLVQYPDTRGSIHDYEAFFARAHAAGALCVVAADLLALTLLRAPGEFGADVAVGSAQRFGVPMGFGGPHAGYLATRDAHKRQMPGRLVGVSKDAQGQAALRLALGTREQHIRREKATSNICTAQVLLGVMASMYAVYHGPRGLRRIAQRTRLLTQILARGLSALGARVNAEPVFDTLTVGNVAAARVHAAAAARRVNLRHIDAYTVGISLDEVTTLAEVELLLSFFGEPPPTALEAVGPLDYPVPHARQSAYLTHEVFNRYHTEHEMLRYIKRLEAKDLSLCHSMISLGSCTMKLNATSEMLPITWAEFARLHPHAPAEQWRGYRALFDSLEQWLAEITGFAAVSLQPNAGSQGEYAGLLAIRAYHRSRGEGERRRVCLIPTSAHGTNPASAVMCGMQVVPVACDEAGNINLGDLRAKAAAHAAELAALMITYPSTHGVFEPGVREICEVVHAHGGQVYMDGANMNAQVGLSSPGFIGADVCHLNLHKTFCIPHGGGGPGVGPIGVAAHLVPFLPKDGRSRNLTTPLGAANGGGPTLANSGSGAVSAAPFGSASILPISWMYIRMMGADGLRRATQRAILNANYIAKRLEGHFSVLYRGAHGLVAHECILEFRDWKARGIEVEDVAKRLIDYGYHAPTMSFPVPGTLMIEPTESETKAELDRFCDALISIHAEMLAVASGAADAKDNVLKNAPHTAAVVSASEWPHPYSREVAAYPDTHTRAAKFWPAVGRVDNVYGDRNLVCACSGGQ